MWQRSLIGWIIDAGAVGGTAEEPGASARCLRLIQLAIFKRTRSCLVSVSSLFIYFVVLCAV